MSFGLWKASVPLDVAFFLYVITRLCSAKDFPKLDWFRIVMVELCVTHRSEAHLDVVTLDLGAADTEGALRGLLQQRGVSMVRATPSSGLPRKSRG